MSMDFLPLPSDEKLLGPVYDIALHPERYDTICDNQSPALHNLRDRNAYPHFSDTFLAHLHRAEDVLDLVPPTSDDAETNEGDQHLQDLAGKATIVFDNSLHIIGLNNSARSLLSVRVGDHLDQLPILDPDRRSLSNCVSRLFTSNKAEPATLRIRPSQSDRLVVFHLRKLTTADGSTFVTSMTSDIHWPENYEDMLRRTFALSRAESEIVRHIVDCNSLNDIAKRRGRSIGTVRNQVKSILAKIGVSSQVELVRMVMSVIDLTTLAEKTPETPTPIQLVQTRLPPTCQRSVLGRDGRNLEYLILGDPNGRPVLYLQSDLALTRLPASIEKKAKQRRLKIISPVRAGYGQSDPVPHHADFCEQVALDLLTVMDAEHAAALPVIAMSEDFQFVPWMHLKRPGSVTALISNAGSFPVPVRPTETPNNPWHRFIYITAQYRPELLPFAAKVCFKAAQRLGKRDMFRRIFAASPSDLDLFNCPEVQAAILAGSNVAVSKDFSGHDTFIKQMLSYNDPDGTVRLNQLKSQVPVYALHGLKDPSLPETLRSDIQARYSWVTYKSYPDAGQLLFFKHPDDAFDLLERHIAR